MNMTQTKSTTQTMILATLFALITGCASSGVERQAQNQIIKTFYATVISEQPIELSSEVETGMALGAGIGVAENLDGNREDMIAGGIAGALVVGLFTALFEGDNSAYQYNLSSETQGDFTLIQKQRLIPNTSCVKVTSADIATMVEVDPSYCANDHDMSLSD